MIAYRHALDVAAIRSAPPLLIAPAMFVLACGLGIAVHLLVEVPLMNLVRRLDDRRRLRPVQRWSA